MEELGGQPWRTLDGTEQWFLVEESDQSDSRREQEMDTAAFHIPRPSNKWWMVGGAAAIAGGLFAALIGSAVATPAPAPPPPPQIIVVAVPPPPAPPPVALAQIAPAPIAPAASTLTQPQRPISKPALIKKRFKHRKRTLR